MVYQVCALVLTIIFGMVGVYFLFLLHSTRLLVEESRKTVETLNEKGPLILDELQSTVAGLHNTTDIIQSGANTLATSLENR